MPSGEVVGIVLPASSGIWSWNRRRLGTDRVSLKWTGRPVRRPDLGARSGESRTETIAPTDRPVGRIFWSADSRFVVYAAGEGLMRAPVAGGPRVLGSFSGARWRRNGAHRRRGCADAHAHHGTTRGPQCQPPAGREQVRVPGVRTGATARRLRRLHRWRHASRTAAPRCVRRGVRAVGEPPRRRIPVAPASGHARRPAGGRRTIAGAWRTD